MAKPPKYGPGVTVNGYMLGAQRPNLYECTNEIFIEYKGKFGSTPTPNEHMMHIPNEPKWTLVLIEKSLVLGGFASLQEVIKDLQVYIYMFS